MGPQELGGHSSFSASNECSLNFILTSSVSSSDLSGGKQKRYGARVYCERNKIEKNVRMMGCLNAEHERFNRAGW